MPKGVTSAFNGLEDFEAAMRAEGFLSLLITASGRFKARLTQISLDDMLLSAAEEQLPRIALVAVPADMLVILFPVGNAVPPVCGGVRIRRGELLALCPGQKFHARTSGKSRWGTIRLRADRLSRYAATLGGAAFSLSPGVQRCRPQGAVGRELRSLHASAVRMAAKQPQILADRETAFGLEQQLLHAAVECMSSGAMVSESRTDRRNREITIRFEQLLRNRNVKPSMGKLCATLGVSERHLRLACASQLGMGPVAYDRLRRMSLMRCDLRHAKRSSL